MLRSRLSKKSAYDEIYGEGEVVNPLENVANLTDVMLVLAVGLLCAMMAAYGLDLGHGRQTDYQPVNIDQTIQAEEMVEQPDEETLEEYGTAYIDEDGHIYLRVE